MDHIVGKALAVLVIVVVWPIVWAVERLDDYSMRGEP